MLIIGSNGVDIGALGIFCIYVMLFLTLQLNFHGNFQEAAFFAELGEILLNLFISILV